MRKQLMENEIATLRLMKWVGLAYVNLAISVFAVHVTALRRLFAVI